MSQSAAVPAYQGNHPRSTQELEAWYAGARQPPALEPGLPIVDAHHHLFGDANSRVRYELGDLIQDFSCGHRIMGTVYVEAYGSGWRTDGPLAMRSTGEIEKIVGLTRSPLALDNSPCQIGAGIVSNVNLTLEDQLDTVLQAHMETSQGRLRGVRHHTAYVEGTVGGLIQQPPPAELMRDPRFRLGAAQLARHGLSADITTYHTQIMELADLADACPETLFVLNHIGTPIGVAEFSQRRDEIFAVWKHDITQLAQRPNVVAKLGGMGMAVVGFGFEHRPSPANARQLVSAWSPYLDACLNAFGSERCMFESNFPVDKNSCSYVELWNAFKLATSDLSEDERKNLFYRTACSTYRLPQLAQACDCQR